MPMKVVRVNTARAKATKGKSHKIVGSAPLGTGERFAVVEEAIAKQGGVRNPVAVAASIGRKKYGQKKMTEMSAAGRKRGKK